MLWTWETSYSKWRMLSLTWLLGLQAWHRAFSAFQCPGGSRGRSGGLEARSVLTVFTLGSRRRELAVYKQSGTAVVLKLE